MTYLALRFSHYITWRHSALDRLRLRADRGNPGEVMREPMILLSVQAMLGQQASEA